MSTAADQLKILLRALKLPSVHASYEEVAAKAEREGWAFARYLLELAEMEVTDRRTHRIERLLRQSGLPRDKTLATLDQQGLPTKVRRQLAALCDGGFLEGAENVLAFGLPGRGKTHCVSAIGHELVHRGHQVLFRPTFALVQQLLAAKRQLTLEKELRRLDRFDVVILDDIGYVQQGRDEMEVLFTLLAERYERKSVMITSNLVFSKWNQIFKDPMTTAAAIDRVVHYSVIVELAGVRSYREEAAQQSKRDKVEEPGETKRQGKGGGSK